MSEPVRVEVVVVGAGPAGLAAAVTAAEAGLGVAVVDAGRQPGGQYWRHPDESVPAPAGAQDLGHLDATYGRLRARFDAVRDAGRVRYLPGRQVWFLEPPPSPGVGWQLRLNGVVDPGAEDDAPTSVLARSVVLCPGGYDRQLPIPGWDLPGVMAAGGVQALLKGHRTLAGRRAVVAGTGPFLLPVATGLAAAGADVTGVYEAGALSSWARQVGGAVQVPSKAFEGAHYARVMVQHRIGYRTRAAVVAIHGDAEVQGVTTARLDAGGRIRPGTERRVEADLVALGWGFTPALELVVAAGGQTRLDVDDSLVAVVDADQVSTVPDVHVAGEATGVGGAVLAVLEGELAGWAVARSHGMPRAETALATRRRARLHRAVARSRAFARAMHLAHPVPRHWADWLTPETTVCRCEEVSYGQVCRVRDDLGAQDGRTVKLLARTGMGWCQGRVCGYATAALAAQQEGRALVADDLRPAAKKPLAAPVSLADLAALDDLAPAPLVPPPPSP